ncbi:MAG: hypothetical protein VX246_06935, partial [Myxococcota bacterium]|nr:hypothetical protein [Myxococcota bacterium]
MSRTAKRWLGTAIALLIAAGLAVTDMIDESPEWADPPSDEVGEARKDLEFGNQSDSVPTVLPGVLLGSDHSEVDARDPSDTGAERGRLVPRSSESVAELLHVSSLDVAPDGHFAPTRAAAALFESYYTAYPHSSDDVVRGRIVLELLDGLTPRAADEAISVLDRWRAARAAELALGVG